MISLLALVLFSGLGADFSADCSDRLYQIEAELPPEYSAADFRAVVHRAQFETRNAGAHHNRHRDLALLPVGDRFLVRIPNENGFDEPPANESRQLDVISHDGFFRGSATIPSVESTDIPNIPMHLSGGSALALTVEEHPDLRSRRPSAILRQAARIVLIPFDRPQDRIEGRASIGRVQRIEALKPGRYHYRVWSNVSAVLEGDIELEQRVTNSLTLKLNAPVRSGELRVRIREDRVAVAEAMSAPALFLLLESTTGVERLFSAQTQRRSFARADAEIAWTKADGRWIGEAVFRQLPLGTYRLSTAPGFGITPESSLVTVGESVKLKLANSSS